MGFSGGHRDRVNRRGGQAAIVATLAVLLISVWPSTASAATASSTSFINVAHDAGEIFAVAGDTDVVVDVVGYYQ